MDLRPLILDRYRIGSPDGGGASAVARLANDRNESEAVALVVAYFALHLTWRYVDDHLGPTSMTERRELSQGNASTRLFDPSALLQSVADYRRRSTESCGCRQLRCLICTTRTLYGSYLQSSRRIRASRPRSFPTNGTNRLVVASIPYEWDPGEKSWFCPLELLILRTIEGDQRQARRVFIPRGAVTPADPPRGVERTNDPLIQELDFPWLDLLIRDTRSIDGLEIPASKPKPPLPKPVPAAATTRLVNSETSRRCSRCGKAGFREDYEGDFICTHCGASAPSAYSESSAQAGVREEVDDNGNRHHPGAVGRCDECGDYGLEEDGIGFLVCSYCGAVFHCPW